MDGLAAFLGIRSSSMAEQVARIVSELWIVPVPVRSVRPGNRTLRSQTRHLRNCLAVSWISATDQRVVRREV